MKHHDSKTKKIPDGINNKLNTMKVGVGTTKKKLEIKEQIPSNLKYREVNKQNAE